MPSGNRRALQATRCSCFDVRPAGHNGPAVCRLTNYSTAVQPSGSGFTAYVDTTKPDPHPGPPVSPGGAARYGCVGNQSGQPFCDTHLTVGARVAALIALLTPEEKGMLMTARTTAQSNAIPRLGVPLFCWGQNAAQGYLQTSVPGVGGGITTFPRAPGMAATWNLSAVASMASVFATEARSLFNQGHIKGSEFSCPGSVVLWGPTINLNRDPRVSAGVRASVCPRREPPISHAPRCIAPLTDRACTCAPASSHCRAGLHRTQWGRNGETASEDPYFNGAYGAAFAEGAQHSDEAPQYLKTIVTLKHCKGPCREHADDWFTASATSDRVVFFSPFFPPSFSPRLGWYITPRIALHIVRSASLSRPHFSTSLRKLDQPHFGVLPAAACAHSGFVLSNITKGGRTASTVTKTRPSRSNARTSMPWSRHLTWRIRTPQCLRAPSAATTRRMAPSFTKEPSG